MLRILHLEDDPVEAGLVLQLLRKEGLEAESERVDTLAELRGRLERGGYGLILSDYTLVGMDAVEALGLTRKLRPEVPFIFFAETIGEDRAVETLKLGASDYVLKQRKERLVPCVRRALEEAQAQEAMRRAGEQLKVQSVALQCAANAISITDRNGAFEWVNAAFERLTGYSAGELRGQNHRLLKSGRQDAEVYQELWNTIAAGRVWHGEIVNQRKDGSLYQEEMTITPVRDSRGEITHFIAIKQDITERKQAEAALRASEQREREWAGELAATLQSKEEILAQLDALLAGAPVGFAFFDRGYRFVKINEFMAQHLAELPVEALLGRPIGEVLPVRAQVVEPLLEVVFHSGRPLGDVVITSGSRGERGGQRHWLTVWFPVRTADGNIRWVGEAVLEITKQKRIEQELHAARGELARANASLERKVAERTAQLAEANTNLQAFSHTAAHDLRSPLRTIKSFSSLLAEEGGAKLDPEQRSLLERVMGAASQMERLLNDLLEYSRMSQAELKLEPVDLREAVGEALALLEADLRGKEAAVTVKEPLPGVIGHHATVVLLINNLVANAMKFMAPGVKPEIRIWAEQAEEGIDGSMDGWIGGEEKSEGRGGTESAAACLGGAAGERGTATEQLAKNLTPHQSKGVVRLWVEDNGIGIAREHLEKIFGAFERLHGKQAYPGTGLGLAMVRRGAERMGGQAGVESEVGQGSRFWVELAKAG